MNALQLSRLLGLWLTPLAGQQERLINALRRVQADDWHQFVGVASHCLLTPALYHMAQRKQLLAYLPVELSDYLHAIHQLNSQRNARLRAQSLRVIDTLNAAGIRPLALKGIASLLTDLYPDEGMRVLGDIDLLVMREELPRALACLRASGYCYATENLLDSYAGHHHAPPLLHSAELGAVELHHDLAPAYASKRLLDVAFCWQRALPLALASRQCYVLHPNARLLHNFHHSHWLDYHFLTGTLSLRQNLEWLYLCQRYQGDIDTAWCLATAQKQGLLTALGSYQRSCQYYYGQPLFNDLPVSRRAALHSYRERCRQQHLLLTRLNQLCSATVLAGHYVGQFSAQAIGRRYPEQSLWQGRLLWWQKLGKRFPPVM